MLSSAVSLYKRSFSGLSRKTWYLSVVMLINRSGTMVIPFMTMYCTQQLGFSLTQAGTVVGLCGLGAIVGAFVGGRITDHFGFYPQQVGALFAGGVMFIVTGFLKTYEALCIGAFILSVCNESFRPANATAIAHYSNEENRTRSYSLNRLAINLGWAVGGAVGGFLAGVDYQLLFWVDGCTNIAAAFLLLKLLPVVKSGSRNAVIQQAEKGESVYKDKLYLAFILLTIGMAFCFFHLFTILPVYYKTQWGLNEQFIGLLMALNGLIIVVVEMAMVYTLEGKKPLMQLISLGILLIGLSYSIINLLPPSAAVAVLAIVVITMGEMLSMPFMNSFWISRTQPANRGQYAALYTIAWSVAQITAPTLGSHIADGFGYNMLWWFISGICMAVSCIFWLLGKRINHKK